MISSWLATPSEKPKLLVIYGPTACGKTGLTVDLAKQYNGEVVLADSRQIYRGMDIGTGKVTQEEMQGIPHHMVDILDISQMYGVGEYAPEARRIIEGIHARGKLPILSGGTGLFIDAVVGNFTIPEVTADWEYRDTLEAFRLVEGDEALWQKLHDIDPLYAAELDPRNYRYVIRGLEVWNATGKSKKVLGQQTESPYDFLRITPYDGDRAKLYERINERVLGMFQTGLVEEVNALLSKYELWMMNYEKNNHQGSNQSPMTHHQVPSEILEKLPGLNAIGYREILDYLARKTSLEQSIEAVQANSRHYAKRQLTWFRRYEKPLPELREANSV